MFVVSINKHSMAENKQVEAKINQTLVLKTIRLHPGISRIRIARVLGLNRSTITHIVNELRRRGLIQESPAAGESSSAGGRRPIGLAVRPGAGAILGVEWQAGFLRYVLRDLAGNCLTENCLNRSIADPQSLIETLQRIIRREEQAMRLPIRGIGLGIPGRVDPHRGVVLQSLPLNLQDYPLASRTGEALGLPVLIDNDANCFAWGEIQEHNGNHKNILCLMLEFHPREDDTFADQEIGLGMVQNGQVYYGSRYSSGELHGPLVDPHRSKEFLRLLGEKDHWDEGRLGPEEKKGMTNYLDLLFTALQPIISVLDPEKVFLGGRFGQIPGVLGTVLQGRKDFPSWAFSTRGEYEVASGSAGHFTAALLKPPLYEEGLQDSGIFWDRVFPQENALTLL